MFWRLYGNIGILLFVVFGRDSNAAYILLCDDGYRVCRAYLMQMRDMLVMMWRPFCGWSFRGAKKVYIIVVMRIVLFMFTHM